MLIYHINWYKYFDTSKSKYGQVVYELQVLKVLVSGVVK